MNRPTTSASNLHRRKLCPGSERMEEGLADEESEQSREGSMLHGYDANPELDRGMLRPYHRDLLRISEELDQMVFERAYAQFGIDEKEPFEGGREEELEVLGEDDALLLPGHCDLWRYWPRIKLLSIHDKKFGYKVVTPAAANIQLRGYAMAGAQRWDPDNIITAVSQPRLSFDERLTVAMYTRGNITQARQELDWILMGARQPNAPLVAGEEQCRYCKAKLICAAYAEKYTRIATLADRSIEECDDSQLDKVLVAIDFAGQIKEQARDEARKRVAAGRMPNYKLGKASEIRKVPDVRKAMAFLEMRGDVTRADVLECADISLGDLEEKIRKRKGCTWKAAREIVDSTLSQVIERKEKKAPLTRIM